jgi:signal transduction histidine kinase
MHLSEPYIVVIVVAIAVVIFWLITGTLTRRREKKLADSRPSENVETFVASFRTEVQPIARAMYAEFQQYALSGHVPLRKSDLAAKTLSLEKEDLDDALQRVANQFECRKPTSEDDRKFHGRETFEDYVEFINHLKTT